MGRRTDPPGRGWFDIEGLQDGERTVEEQLTGLAPLLERIRSGDRVLDLGCAEGLIGLECFAAGAGLVHGVESVASRVGRGRQLCAGAPVEFFVFDLAGFAEASPAGLLPRYEVVLALSIAHKFADPAGFLSAAMARCGRLLAVRLPSAVLRDRRSEFKPLDVPALAGRHGFALAHQAPGPRGEWAGLFERAP